MVANKKRKNYIHYWKTIFPILYHDKILLKNAENDFCMHEKMWIDFMIKGIVKYLKCIFQLYKVDILDCHWKINIYVKVISNKKKEKHFLNLCTIFHTVKLLNFQTATFSMQNSIEELLGKEKKFYPLSGKHIIEFISR